MLRVGQFGIELRRPAAAGGQQRLHSVTARNETFVVAAPGETFEICYTYTGPQRSTGRCYMVYTKVDGKDVGVRKLVFSPGNCTVPGFLRSGDATRTTYDSFVFAQPQADTSRAVHSLDFSEGRISCEIYDAVEVGESRPCYEQGSRQASVAAMPEGKKFFLAPSLTTAPGAPLTERGLSTKTYKSVGPPVASLELRYETCSTLLLRKVLDPAIPAHQAILDEFDETRQFEQGGGSGRGALQAGQERAAAGGGCGGARVKRERAASEQDQQRPAQRPRTEFVDLTIDENDEVLAAKARDEVLECDLSGRGGPAWAAVKKEAVELD